MKGNDHSEFDKVDPSRQSRPIWKPLEKAWKDEFFRLFWANINLKILAKLHYCSNVTVLHLIMDQTPLHWVEVLDLTALKYLSSLIFDIWNSQIEARGLGSLKSLGLLVCNDMCISLACLEDDVRLMSLQVLQLSCGECDELPDLTNVKLLEVVRLDTGGNRSKLSGLSYMLSKLQKLSLRFWRESTTCACYGICEIMALQELKIEGFVKVEEVFDLSNLTNLQRVSILRCQSIKALPGLDGFVALKSFHLCGYECECCGDGELASLPQI